MTVILSEHEPPNSVEDDESTVPPLAPPQASDPAPDLAKEVAELKRQNQELAAKVSAMEEEDAALERSLLSKESPFPSR